jgi:hypothetical protein
MSIAPKQVGLAITQPDMPTGGSIVLLPDTRSEQYRAFSVSQTTAGQSVAIPDPTDASIVFSLDVYNTGSVSFTIYGVTLTAGSFARFGWNGETWAPDVAPTSTGTVVENLTPTAQNTVPDVSSAPAAGTSAIFFVNGVLIPDGISMNVAGEISVSPATIGYNIETVDVVTVVYYAA